MNLLGRPDDCISQIQLDWNNYMRLLWEQHVVWTRLMIISIVFQLPDVEYTVARLLQNATDMGNSLKQFYGNKVGERYGQLKENIWYLQQTLSKPQKQEIVKLLKLLNESGMSMQMR